MCELINPWTSVVPAPNALVMLDGACAHVRISDRDGDSPVTVYAEDTNLSSAVSELISVLVPAKAITDPAEACVVVLPVADSSRSKADAAIDARSNGDEVWTVECRPVNGRPLSTEPNIRDAGNQRHEERTGRLTISASGYRGVMRAAAVVAQALCRASRDAGGRVLPPARVEGRPRYPWRGVMLDSARHIFPVDAICKLMDFASLHGINVFHWHLSDDQGWRIPSKEFPELEQVAAWRDDNTTDFGQYGGVYDRADIDYVVNYAARRGIIVVPEIDIPGHVRAVLAAKPELSCTNEQLPIPKRHGVFADVLCAGEPRSHKFLKTVFSELCDLFPGRFVHVGGDECPSTRWQTCPKCQQRMSEKGLDSASLLHGDLVNTAVETLLSHDRIPVAWDEVLESSVPVSVIIMCWRNREAVHSALEAGHDVVSCPTDRACYFDHKHIADPSEPGRLSVCTVKDTYTFELTHAEEGASPKSKPQVIGSQGVLWTEEVLYGRQIEYLMWPRLAALAEVLYGTTSQNWPDASSRLRSHAELLQRNGLACYLGPFEQTG